MPNVLPSMLLIRTTSLLIVLLSLAPASAQFLLQRDQSVPVFEGGSQLELPWVGGLNFCQFSSADLNNDGDLDIFVFDRSGNEVIVLVNDGNGQYRYDPALSEVEPFNSLRSWALLRDQNCDGKQDIFTYSTGGFKVFKNTSTGAIPSYVEIDTLVRSNYVPTDANLYVTQIDLPAIEDIDGDGDLDVLTFSIFGAYVEYHKNLSMETHGTCDSLVYEVRNRCWGQFYENLNNNSVTLNTPCNYNVVNPEYPLEIAKATAADRARQNGTGEMDRAAAHTGSTLLAIDLDADGVKDLILGDISHNTLNALFNGGTVTNSLMVSQDSLFPVYDQPVQLPVYPGIFYVDVNGDGVRDLIVSPNNSSLSQNFESVWYYLNTGTDAGPIFEFQQTDLFQDEMIDLGEGAMPVLFDHNGDGLMDLIVSNHGYYASGGDYPAKMALLLNTGTASDPAFTLTDRDYMGLSMSGIGNSMYPAFGDLDGDGDEDMLIGDLNGHIHFYRNVTTNNEAQFQLETPNIVTVGNTVIDVGQFATPQLVDMDDDALLDLVIGERNGNINYYRNVGTPQQAAWTLLNDSLGMVVVAEWLGQSYNVSGYSIPHVFMNENGQRELLVGSESGYIYHYTGIDGNLNGVFTQVDTTFQHIKDGIRSSIVVFDMNGDGQNDAITGNYRGGLAYWNNSALAVHEQDALQNGIGLVPNPAAEAFRILLGDAWESGMRYEVLTELGQLVASGPLQTNTTIGTRGLAPGMYLVRAIRTNGVSGVGRLVVQ